MSSMKVSKYQRIKYQNVTKSCKSIEVSRRNIEQILGLSLLKLWKRMICLVQDPDKLNLTCATMCCQLCFAGLLDEKVFLLRLSSLGRKSLITSWNLFNWFFPKFPICDFLWHSVNINIHIIQLKDGKGNGWYTIMLFI